MVLLEKKREVADRDANAFFRKTRATDFLTAAETYGVEVRDTGTFRGTDNLEGFGPNGPLVEIGLAIQQGETAPPVEWRLKMIVAKLIGRSDIDPEEFESRRRQIHRRLMQQKVNEYMQAWYENLEGRAQIEDYRLQS